MIGLGCDHGGLELKKTVMEYLDSKGIEYKDFGTYTSDSCDYPVYGKAVAHAVADGQCDKGIIICGTGIGISITANKVKGNDANILAMGARVIGPGLALEIVKAFLETEFSGDERHIRRIAMIEE